MDMQTVMVVWRKGWVTYADTVLVEVADGSVWLGRLGKGGAYWEPRPDLHRYVVRPDGVDRPDRRLGAKIGMAAGQKALGKFRAEIERNEERFWAEGRAALAGDKRTTEWPLADFADARLVETLPGTGPPAMKALGPGFVEVRLGGKPHFFAGLPHGASAEEFHDGLMAALGR